MKRSAPLRRLTPLRARSTLGSRTSGSPKPAPKKITNKGYQVPKWFNAIKPGSHGSTPAQKRLWRVVSEYVRQRDFVKYGCCVSCGYEFSDWREAQAGHWLPYSVCHSLYKFDPTFNIAAQCFACNNNLRRSGAHIGHAFGEELRLRHGPNVLETIIQDNERLRGIKIQEYMCVDFAVKLRPELQESADTTRPV